MVNDTTTTLETTTFALIQMGCSDCYWKVENGLKELPGVHQVNYDRGKISFEVTFDPKKNNRTRLIKSVEDMGFRIKGKHYETVGVFEAIRLAFQRNKAQKKTNTSKSA